MSQVESNLDSLLTSKEAASYLRISTRTLWSLTQRGDVPVVRIHRSVRYRASDLRSFVESNVTSGTVTS